MAMVAIKGLHHSAYRCRDSEETRRFYEDFLGLPLVATLELHETKTGRKAELLHTFYRMADGSHLAFFEAPQQPHTFVEHHDFDLHIALEVDRDHMMHLLEKGKAAGMDVRGPTDHDFIHSIYFRDPNGYVIELATKMPHHDDAVDPAKNDARAKLDRWQQRKPRAV